LKGKKITVCLGSGGSHQFRRKGGSDEEASAYFYKFFSNVGTFATPQLSSKLSAGNIQV